MQQLKTTIKTKLKSMLRAPLRIVLTVLALSVTISVVAAYFYPDVVTVLLLVLVLSLVIIDIRMKIFTQEAANKHFTEQLKSILTASEKQTDLQNDLHVKLAENRKKTIEENLNQNRNLYIQIESLLNLKQLIQPRRPLPSMSRWAATSDLALLIASTIEKERCKTIVDLGSGVSSLVAGYAVEKAGKGKVISVDHEEEFYEKTQRTIQEHKLVKQVDLRHAPLHQQKINGVKHYWYDIEKLQDVENIDLLIVDGPPGNTQKHARYPAVPLLYDKLAKGATVVLDDYYRQEEKEITEMWLEQYPDLAFEEVRSDKGIAIFRKL